VWTLPVQLAFKKRLLTDKENTVRLLGAQEKGGTIGSAQVSQLPELNPDR